MRLRPQNWIWIVAVMASFLYVNEAFRSRYLQKRCEEFGFMLSRLKNQVYTLTDENKSLLGDKLRFEQALMDRVRWDYVFKNQATDAETRLKSAVEEARSIKDGLGRLEGNLANAKKYLAQMDKNPGKTTKDLEGLMSAISYYRKRFNAQEALLRYNLGVVAFACKDFDSALSYFESSVRLDPKEAESYYSLGLLYEGYKTNTGKAIRNYKEFLKISSDIKRNENVQQKVEALTHPSLSP